MSRFKLTKRLSFIVQRDVEADDLAGALVEAEKLTLLDFISPVAPTTIAAKEDQMIMMYPYKDQTK